LGGGGGGAYFLLQSNSYRLPVIFHQPPVPKEFGIESVVVIQPVRRFVNVVIDNTFWRRVVLIFSVTAWFCRRFERVKDRVPQRSMLLGLLP
jgi:hypothetical protein